MRIILSDHEDPTPEDIMVDARLLRDYFAAQAVGLFQLNDENIKAMMMQQGSPMHDLVAQFCYGLADAMMKERGK